jgi:hypothetical protein
MKPYSLNDEVMSPKRLSREHTLRIREIVREAKDVESAKKAIAEYANSLVVGLYLTLGSKIEIWTGFTGYLCEKRSRGLLSK